MSAKIAPVFKELVIEATQARAFKVFTSGIDRWWPRQHHIGKSPLKECVLEPKPGGRWYSICEDGSEVDIGKVLAWEPDARVLLSWQINGEWKFDPEFVTEVEVRFESQGPRRTRVTLEHRDLERFGETAEKMRDSIDSAGGWKLLVELFGKEAERES